MHRANFQISTLPPLSDPSEDLPTDLSHTTEPQYDVVLQPALDCLILFPIRYDDLWMLYKRAAASYWTVEEIDFRTDIRDWSSWLSGPEREFLTFIFGFLATADTLVSENIVDRFCSKVQIMEARCFYGFQNMIENVHTEVYATFIDVLIQDPLQRRSIFHSISITPAVVKKAAWIERWTARSVDRPFGLRLVAFAAVEGIFFSGLFAVFFWLKKRGLMPGLAFANELIARDEALHTKFACALFSYLANKPSVACVMQIMDEATSIETRFWSEACPLGVIGLNAVDMMHYIKYIANRLLVDLGYEKHFHSHNPFPWMEMVSVEGKTNFFEKRVSNYQKANLFGSRGEPLVFKSEF